MRWSYSGTAVVRYKGLHEIATDPSPRTRCICTSFTNLKSNRVGSTRRCTDPTVRSSRRHLMMATRARTRIVKLAQVAVLAAAVSLLPRLAVAAETLAIALDQATLMKLPEKVSTIVVGNPLIAD